MAFFLRPGYFDDEDDFEDFDLPEPLPVDEDYVRRMTNVLLDDQSPLPMNFTLMQAWIILGAIQHTVRSPVLHQPLKDALEHVGRQLQAEIVKAHPDAQDLAEMGWDERYDR